RRASCQSLPDNMMLVFTFTSSSLTIGSSLVGVVPMAANRRVDGALILDRFAPPLFLPEPPDPDVVLLLAARLRCLELPMLVIDLLGLVHFVEALLGTGRVTARHTPHSLDHRLDLVAIGPHGAIGQPPELRPNE